MELTNNSQNNVIIKNEIKRNSVKKKALTISEQIVMLFAETLGTMLLVLFGCLGTINWFNVPGHITPSLNFGLVVMVVVHIFGHISHAILNPAIVITAIVHKLIGIKLAILYVIAQIIGAILGYGLLYALTPHEFYNQDAGSPGVCVTALHPAINVVQGFFIEFFLTSALVFVVCSVWDPRNKDKGDSASIKIGLTVASMCLAGGPFTQASMNPARSLGPAIWNWEWDNHWMYWVSTLSASLVTSVCYRLIFWKDPEQEFD